MRWYFVADDKGRRIEGHIDATTKKKAEKELREKGYYPLKVEKDGKSFAEKDIGGKKTRRSIQQIIQEQKNKIPDKEVGKLFENLEVLLKSNITLTDSWRIVKSNKNSKNMTIFLDEVEKKLNKGYTLSQCMGEYSFINTLALAIIKTGEEVGDLETSFKQVSLLYSQKDEIQSKIMKAMAYPVMLVLTVVIMVYAISTKILPSLIESMGDQIEINAVTEIFIWLSDLLQNHSVTLLVTVLAITVGPIVIFKSLKPMEYDIFIMRIPFIGDILKQRIEIAVLRNFSLLYGGGVDTVQILDMVKSVSGSLVYLENINRISEGVKQGDTISSNLSEFIYSPTTINIFKVSEATGNIAEPFSLVAENTEKQLDESIEAFIGVITPISVIVLAGLVMMLIVGIMIPIFSIYNL